MNDLLTSPRFWKYVGIGIFIVAEVLSVFWHDRADYRLSILGVFLCLGISGILQKLERGQK